MSKARPQMAYDVPDTYERLIAPRYAPVADALVALAAPTAGERVLELGAGTGLVTRRLVGRITAVDKYEQMLGHAQATVDAPNVDWRVGDYNEPLGFPPESFDLAVSGLTYVQDADAAVAELFRVLKPGGRLALSMWAPSYLELDLMNRAKAQLGDEPIPAPDPQAAAERLAGAGFAGVTVRALELAPEYASVDDYLDYRRGFGLPVGATEDGHRRFLEALGREAAAIARPDGSFRQGWRFALISAKRPAAD
jgi:SAM-dependent methyltransferase